MRLRQAYVRGLLLTGIVLIAGCGRTPAPPPVDSLEDNPSGKAGVPIPELSSSPYLNTRSGVAYVGDAICAKCHRIHAESYAHHSMGRALIPVREFLAHERIDSESNNPFSLNGLRFRVEKRGDRLDKVPRPSA